MAPHFDDYDYFEEYDPQPYEGGYDISLTYGRPLPPSPSTCYPISQESGHLPEPGPPLPLPPLPTLPESAQSPEPYAPLPLPPPPESAHCPEPYALIPLPPPPEPNQYGSYTHDECGYRPEGNWPDLDVFGFWPFLTGESASDRRGVGADVEEVGYWNQWKRAGDYLFGYSQGYGERRIGVDSYGIPIYANKREWSQPVTLQMEPARDLKVDSYESPSWFSSYDEKKDESFGYAYNKCHQQEPLHFKENLTEPMLYQRLTYHEIYEEQAYPQLEWQMYSRERGDESNFHGNDQYAYERQQNEQPLCVELEPYKPTWSQNLNYKEYYSGEVSLESNFHSSLDNGVGEESNFSGDPNDAYGRHYYEQPQCVQLEPFKPAWAQNPTFYEPYMQEVSQSSWADDCLKQYDAEYFNPYLKYSHYDE